MATRTVTAVDVPIDQNQARAILDGLYDKGDDAAICAAFDQFEAVLEPCPGAMDRAYMAKVNVAINGSLVDEPRVRAAIGRFREAIARGDTQRGSLLYCEGNAWMALGDDAKARKVFENALADLQDPKVAHVAAQRADQRDAESALLWDRVGHWAQDDKRWPEAAEAYRKAFDVDPDLYGYCLGTALNSLGQYEEALPMLLAQAEAHQPDPKSWFQVAIAREGVEDTAGCIAAYERALELDPDYDLAWFNLGGIQFNAGDIPAARATWTEALRRFPEHPLAAKVRETLPSLLDPDESDG